jgi:hypothetical protein
VVLAQRGPQAEESAQAHGAGLAEYVGVFHPAGRPRVDERAIAAPEDQAELVAQDAPTGLLLDRLQRLAAGIANRLGLSVKAIVCLYSWHHLIQARLLFPM